MKARVLMAKPYYTPRDEAVEELAAKIIGFFPDSPFITKRRKDILAIIRAVARDG